MKTNKQSIISIPKKQLQHSASKYMNCQHMYNIKLKKQETKSD